MDFKPTAQRKLRGTKPDFVDETALHVLKAVSELRATYQIKLLAYFAVRDRKKLVIHLLKSGTIHGTLRELQSKVPGTIDIRLDI